jgi:hypothetical protein
VPPLSPVVVLLAAPPPTGELTCGLPKPELPRAIVVAGALTARPAGEFVWVPDELGAMPICSAGTAAIVCPVADERVNVEGRVVELIVGSPPPDVRPSPTFEAIAVGPRSTDELPTSAVTRPVGAFAAARLADALALASVKAG